ncbi:Stp1/IreP family PP2C-type Ser/Thr phosphatase [Desulfobacca acetoxidans]|uniref:Protein serine/threonine phosphatase n=1 Tax=Desulfobacca acetoxidans (strain ATCC 700848 / DSM 11109 / ASRB2) TaxID=880072 RepID=F2NIX6_DESAR|nr:Stp1/IreP family PP2C-type Ser/Thr phosphatase [Desulfobacca acetoxidans]AEB10741.1 protein serine/threonine phosphatase [Desulfobacca acetoxidans DSM 11109]HAY21814.1 Stp1/IreP family PP2C-type Ser/Thr phosphatase [Desulfobacterales bacterium]
MKLGYSSHPGKIRPHNEDFLLIDQLLGLYLVADGVGGAQGGEVASQLAAESIQQTIQNGLRESPEPDFSVLLQQAFADAHAAVLSRAEADQSLTGMATTAVVGLLTPPKLHIAHIGDSRAYLINSRGIMPLTEDHSYVSQMVKSGLLSPREAQSHSLRHIITQCLGCPEYQGPDIKNIDLIPGDIVLLCSDGLTDMVPEKKINKVVRRRSDYLQEAADKLVTLANKNGGRDNISVILLVPDY